MGLKEGPGFRGLGGPRTACFALALCGFCLGDVLEEGVGPSNFKIGLGGRFMIGGAGRANFEIGTPDPGWPTPDLIRLSRFLS